MPDNYEIEAILGRVRDLRGRPASLREELSEGLGTLLYDTDRHPADVSPRIPNEPYRPGLSRADVVHGDGEVRSIIVRLPYADTRGRKKLGREALQLPRDDRGLVMIDTAGAGSRHTWSQRSATTSTTTQESARSASLHGPPCLAMPGRVLFGGRQADRQPVGSPHLAFVDG